MAPANSMPTFTSSFLVCIDNWISPSGCPTYLQTTELWGCFWLLVGDEADSLRTPEAVRTQLRWTLSTPLPADVKRPYGLWMNRKVLIRHITVYPFRNCNGSLKTDLDQQQWCHTENNKCESIKSLNIKTLTRFIIFHNESLSVRFILWAHCKMSFYQLGDEAECLLESICYRSAESLVSVQSILAHQRSMPLYTLSKCKKAKPLRINPIRK